MDDLETRLARELSDEARRAAVPPYDAQALVLVGRREALRRRTRTAWYAVAAVAAVALVVAGTGLGVQALRDDGSHHNAPVSHQTTPLPRQVAQLPHGPSPQTPYWLHGYLYSGSDRIRVSQPVLLSAGGRSLVVTMTPHGLYRVAMLDGSRLVHLQAADSVPAMSPDGQYAAWELPHRGAAARIVLWDLSDASQVAAQTFPSAAHCCDAPSLPVGVDQRGGVYIWDGGRPLLWDHVARRVTEIAGSRGDLSSAHATGPVFVVNSGSVYGELDPAFRPIGRFPAQQGSWSPSPRRSAEAVAYLSPEGVPTVLDTETGSRTAMHLPPGDYVVSAWEDERSFLVAHFFANRTTLLRCDTVDASCEVARTFPAGTGPENLVLPNPD